MVSEDLKFCPVCDQETEFLYECGWCGALVCFDCLLDVGCESCMAMNEVDDG